MGKYERHVFVCVNERPAGSLRSCCRGCGAERVLAALKSAAGRHGLGDRVRVNKAGCLDQCEHGPTVVVYPDAVWYGFVKPEDAEEIVVAHLVGGRPVARLMLAECCVNTERCAHKDGGGRGLFGGERGRGRFGSARLEDPAFEDGGLSCGELAGGGPRSRMRRGRISIRGRGPQVPKGSWITRTG